MKKGARCIVSLHLARAGDGRVKARRDFSLRRPSLYRSKGKEKNRPAPFEMTDEGGSGGPYLAFALQGEYTLISL